MGLLKPEHDGLTGQTANIITSIHYLQPLETEIVSDSHFARKSG